MERSNSVAVALSLLLLGLCAFDTVAINMQHSFQPNYHNTVPFWKHGAGAYVNQTYVRLTPARQSRTGYFWNTIRSKMTDWEVEFDFQIKGAKMLGGDGFAFWYTDTPEVLGMVYGAADYWRGLGVFFDTYDNNAAGQNPLITAVVNDGTMKYDSGSDGEEQAIGKCSYQLRNLDKPSRCKIKYLDETLSISIAVDKDGEFEPCFRVSNVKLGIDKYFGLSAHTGDVADSHDIFQFSATDLSDKGGTNEDLDHLRDEYKKYINEQNEEHDMMDTKQFQHQSITMLHQIQDSLTVLEGALEGFAERELAQKAAGAMGGQGGGAGGLEVLSSLEVMSQRLGQISEAVELQSHHPPVDRDFIERQLKAIRGEIVSLRGGSKLGGGVPGSINKEINDLKNEQIDIKMMLGRIERSLGGSSGGFSSSRNYGRDGGGTSWFMYLVYLVIFAVLIGGALYGYKSYQRSQQRQYKLL